VSRVGIPYTTRTKDIGCINTPSYFTVTFLKLELVYQVKRTTSPMQLVIQSMEKVE
jgi:hypothetical protein